MKNEITVKFGGSSLADADKIAAAVQVLLADGARKNVIVSAPGKADGHPTKVTDALLAAWDGNREAYDAVKERFTEIAAAFSLRDTAQILSCLPAPDSIFCRFLGKDYFVSRGEYCMARLFAEILGWEFVDASEVIAFDEAGRYDEKQSFGRIRRRLQPGLHYVLPGFYGSTPNGTIVTFPRGGSDITGAIVAAALGNRYENLTDVRGVLSADPRTVPDARLLPCLTYSEMRFLSHFGAAVLQEDALLPAAGEGIPVRLGLASEGGAGGTDILPLAPSRLPFYARSGKCGYTLLRISKKNALPTDRLQTMQAVESCGITVEAVSAYADIMTLLLESSSLLGLRKRLLHRLCRTVRPDTAVYTDGVAAVAAIGQSVSLPVEPLADFSAPSGRLYCISEAMLPTVLRAEP